MSELEPGTIGGGWLGTYAYKGALAAQPPVRFEATLTPPDSDGRFTGSILDDGGLGEADVRGEQSGTGLRFSKIYRRRGQAMVSYEGTLADDGQTMQGTWQIRAAHGVWDARRAWSEISSTAAEETVEEYEVPRVREVVRLG
jgi:hypothetical protein